MREKISVKIILHTFTRLADCPASRDEQTERDVVYREQPELGEHH
jgi:hypothetical protein